MPMTNPVPGSSEWYAQVDEEVVEPERPIVDAHHHLWHRPPNTYMLDEFWTDTGSGHRVEKSIFVQCRGFYRQDGPEHLKPVGETLAIAEIAGKARAHQGRTEVAGIVAFVDMTRGAAVAEVLDAHEEAGQGLFCGVRQSAANDPNPEALAIPGQVPAGLYGRSDFREALKVLGSRGLPFDAWHFHHQNGEFAELARAVPGTILVLDHFGTPLGVGPYAGRRSEIFGSWKKDMAALAQCPNVYAKLGGLAMPDNGFGWDKAARPPTSDEFVAAQQDYYLHAIDCFGPDRCMFESNFPADKPSISYRTLWNGLKKISARFTESEKDALFRKTAEKLYRL